jgi:type VI protein secretion system component VasF
MSAVQDTVLTQFDQLFGVWRRALSKLDTQLSDIASDDEGDQLRELLLQMQSDLLGALDELKKLDARLDSEARKQRENMRYAAVAYFDDYLLQRYPWAALADDHKAEAKKVWLGLLLESSVFGTRYAGRGLPKRVHELIYLGHYTASELSLLRVYVRILWLGFGPQEARTIQAHAELKDRAITVLVNHAPSQPRAQNAMGLGWMPPPGQKIARLAPVAKLKRTLQNVALAAVAFSFLAWIFLSLQLHYEVLV